MAWACWWVIGLILPFIQWHALAPLYSIQLSWMSTGFAAMLLGMNAGGSWTTWPAGALLLLSVLGAGAGWALSSRADLPWMFVWSSWANTALPWVAGLVGGWVASQTMRPLRVVPQTLAFVLGVSACLWWAQSQHLNVLRRFWESNGGLFNTGTSLAVVSAVSLPLLWAWSPGSSLFALFGLWVGQSACAWWAAGCWVTYCWFDRADRRFVWPFLGLLAVLGDGVNRWVNVGLRLHTWAAYGWHALTHPFGWMLHPAVAWHPAPLGAWPMSSIPLSDWLAVTVTYGWLAGVALLWVGWGLWHTLPAGVWRQAVTMAGGLALVQSAWSNLQSGMLLWLIVIAAVAATRRTDGTQSETPRVGFDSLIGT